MACDEPDVSDATLSQEVSVMGYSMRTPYYRFKLFYITTNP